MDEREFETVGAVLTLIGGLLEFVLPLNTLYTLLQGTAPAHFPVEETLLAILAIVGCVIIWKGASVAGGVMGIIVGIFILEAPNDFKYRTVSSLLVIIGGAVALGGIVAQRTITALTRR